MARPDTLDALFAGAIVSGAIVLGRFLYFKIQVHNKSQIVSSRKSELWRQHCEEHQASLNVDKKPIIEKINTSETDGTAQISEMFNSNNVSDPSFLNKLCENDCTCSNAQLALDSCLQSLSAVEGEVMYPLMFAGAYCAYNQFFSKPHINSENNRLNKLSKGLINQLPEKYAIQSEHLKTFKDNIQQVIEQTVYSQLKIIFSVSDSKEVEKRLSEIAEQSLDPDKGKCLQMDYILQQTGLAIDELCSNLEAQSKDL